MLCLGFKFNGQEIIVLKANGKIIKLQFFRDPRGGKKIGIEAPPEVEIYREKVEKQQ